MKSLLFILLAGYAVRSQENNYYVIEMPDDPPIRTKKPFNVYWNVPTMQCASKKIHFENLYEKFGIIQNDNDRFKGDRVTILYDPGLFPALFKNETSGKFRLRNGGVPQEGDLDKHLDAFTKELDESIPNKEFNGVGIIDFESWRPVFRQNFGELVPYKEMSIEIERRLHWWWKEAWLQAEAKRRFEEAARTFMQTTLSVAKKLRPRALWGFYGFPYCFNMASNNMQESCAKNVPEENDRISWLWSESTALYPSVYSSAVLPARALAALLRGRVREAARAARAADVILPYFWFRYRDAGYFTETDLDVALATFYKSEATGFIIWGSSNDVNTLAKCKKLLEYVENVFGPAIAKYTKQLNRIDEATNDVADNTNLTLNAITTESPFNDTSTNSNTKIDVVPDFDGTQQENSTQNVQNNVDDNITNKFSQKVTPGNDNKSVLNNNSILIDLILSPVLNVDNGNLNNTDTAKIKDKTKNLPEYLVSSTTEMSATVVNTGTSQVTNSVITENPLFNDNSSSQVKIITSDTASTNSSKPFDITTTKETSVQSNIDIDTSNIQSVLETDDSITERTTPVYDYETTENDYEATFDDDDDYFFNSDTFDKYDFKTNNKDITTDIPSTDLETKLSKNEKKSIFTTILEHDSSTINTETTTEIEEPNTPLNKIDFSETDSSEYSTVKDTAVTRNDSTTESNNEINTSESSTNTITTHFVSTQRMRHTTKTLPSITTTLRSKETITDADGLVIKTQTYKDESGSSNITILNWLNSNNANSNAIPNDISNSAENQPDLSTNTEDLEPTKRTEFLTDTIEIRTEKSEESENTQHVEETSTSIVPTSTEQVVVYH